MSVRVVCDASGVLITNLVLRVCVCAVCIFRDLSLPPAPARTLSYVHTNKHARTVKAATTAAGAASKQGLSSLLREVAWCAWCSILVFMCLSLCMCMCIGGRGRKRARVQERAVCACTKPEAAHFERVAMSRRPRCVTHGPSQGGAARRAFSLHALRSLLPAFGIASLFACDYSHAGFFLLGSFDFVFLFVLVRHAVTMGRVGRESRWVMTRAAPNAPFLPLSQFCTCASTPLPSHVCTHTGPQACRRVFACTARFVLR